MTNTKERYIRSFPGRIRTEVFGLQNNSILEQKFRSIFLRLPGVTNIRTLAGAAWCLTRNPWIGLAVLLAMNPRLVITPTIALWKQTETFATENGLPLPKNGTLTQVARMKTLIIEDSAQIFHPSSQEIALINNENPEKIWRICAALLEKSRHPWKELISEKANVSQLSKKTAFS